MPIRPQGSQRFYVSMHDLRDQARGVPGVHSMGAGLHLRGGGAGEPDRASKGAPLTLSAVAPDCLKIAPTDLEGVAAGWACDPRRISAARCALEVLEGRRRAKIEVGRAPQGCAPGTRRHSAS